MSKIRELKGVREVTVYLITRLCEHKEYHSIVLGISAVRNLTLTPCDDCAMKQWRDEKHVPVESEAIPA